MFYNKDRFRYLNSSSQSQQFIRLILPSKKNSSTSEFYLKTSAVTVKLVGIGIPVCVQCGTASNPCRCKVVGPTLGFLAFAAAAVVEWPVGALVYMFRHTKGRKIMGHPATVVYPSVTDAIPI